MFEITELIKAVGLIGVVLIVFAESGLFIGFFLPGDSLLFTAGILASQGLFDVHLLVILTFIAAVLGDNFGYVFGKKVGKALFNRENSRFFKKENLLKAQAYYEKHGSKTIVLARFTPIVRTFAPIVAGAGNMHYRTFVTYNIVGGFIWTFGITYLGYFLGNAIPNIDHYIIPGVIIIVLVSVLPMVKEYFAKK